MAIRSLLLILRDPDYVRAVSLADWDGILRLARQARLLASMYYRVTDIAGLADAIPHDVMGHLLGARNFSIHRTQLLRMEIDALDRALPKDVPVCLLKGAAYLAQELSFSRGRLPGDVDILVQRTDLDRSEQALLADGWAFQTQDAYDLRYYRQWSHELPPMRAPGHALEVDLHHDITPVTSRYRASSALLFQGMWVPSGRRFLVLHPHDQIIHAMVHLMQDSDLSGRLRDVLDIDSLIRQYLQSESDWAGFYERVKAHGMANPVWYALHYCQKWLATPVPALPIASPPRIFVAALDRIMTWNCLPRFGDRSPGAKGWVASAVATARYHWLRMPLRLLIPHLMRKGLRRLVQHP